NEQWTRRWVLWEEQRLAVTVGPARLLGLLAGLALVALLYRRITSLGKLTVVLWLGGLATIAWILIEGALHFRAQRAFDFSCAAASWPSDLATRLGPAMILAVYSYLGYYNVCYLGDEVRDPGRTIPVSILASVLVVSTLFVGIHLAMLGTVSWKDVPPGDDSFSLPAKFMETVHGPWAASLLTVLLIGCC